MDNYSRETVETSGMTDRQLLVDMSHSIAEIAGHVQEINGGFQDHDDEIYGNPEKQIVGIKPQQVENTAYITSQRTVFKTLAVVFGVVASGEAVALAVLAAKVF